MASLNLFELLLGYQRSCIRLGLRMYAVTTRRGYLSDELLFVALYHEMSMVRRGCDDP